MKFSILRAFSIASLCALLPLTSKAALKVGDPAPDFSTEAALGGKSFHFVLADALKQGPVVVYFYPKAFTRGCTVEAHLFADATERFHALGATVIGISNDDIDTLKRFSTEACRDKFAVGADRDSTVIKAYDAKMTLMPGMADRISYVVDSQGRIAYVHSSMKPEEHVTNTLAAVEKIQAKR